MTGTTEPRAPHRRRTARWLAMATMLVCGLTATDVPGVGAEAATAATEPPIIDGLWIDDRSVRGTAPGTATVRLQCPTGKKVIGGGGEVHAYDGTAVLTGVRPADDVLGNGTGHDGYVVTGGGNSTNFDVTVQVVCATESTIRNWHIRAAGPSKTSDTVQATRVGCASPSTQRVLGVGAKADGGGSEVGIQIARVSDVGDITRAQAHEDPSGYSGQWGIVAYAICADWPPGYEVVGERSRPEDSESSKSAAAVCPISKASISSGGALWDRAPAETMLTSFHQAPIAEDAGPVYASAREVWSTSADWDYIIARGVCVARD